jgi:hypothetical protein
MEGCNGKLDRYNDLKIYKMLTVYQTVETPVTSACLSVARLELNTYHVQNTLLHIKSAERHKHYMLVIMEYCYIDKGS